MNTMVNGLRCALLSGVLIASGTAASADEPVSSDALYACAGIDDDTARLACYDDAVGRFKAAEEAGEITTVSREEIEQVERESFGFSLPSLPRLSLPSIGGGDDDDGLDEIVEAVARVRTDPYGKLVVTLENGQVWRQIDTKEVYVSRSGVDEATIRRAAFGSFRMSLDGGRGFKVRREE